LKHIPKNKRKTEKTLWQEFNKVKGDILGGFLDALSKAIKIHPTVKLDQLHRMADFVKWGCAISEALGIDKKKFLAAYDVNVEIHTEEAARSSPVAEVVLKFMDGKLSWEGSPSELYSELLEKAKEMGVSTRQKAWPKAPNTLIRRINELVPALAQFGYEVVETRKNKTRIIRINTVTTVTSDKVHENDGKTGDDTSDDAKGRVSSPEGDGKISASDDSDGSDGILRTSSSRSKFDLNSSVTEENVLGWLRLDWKGGSEAEFDELLQTQKYTAEQASRLRQKWVNQGLLRDHSGLLVLTDCEGEEGSSIVAATKVRHVPPGEPCELCHNNASEWQIAEDKDHTRMCNGCFNRLRANGQQFTFLEGGEAESEKLRGAGYE